MITYGPYYISCLSPNNQNSVPCSMGYNPPGFSRTTKYIAADLNQNPIYLKLVDGDRLSKYTATFYLSHSDNAWNIYCQANGKKYYVDIISANRLALRDQPRNSRWYLGVDGSNNSIVTISTMQAINTTYIRSTSANDWWLSYTKTWNNWGNNFSPYLDEITNKGYKTNPRKLDGNVSCNYLFSFIAVLNSDEHNIITKSCIEVNRPTKTQILRNIVNRQPPLPNTFSSKGTEKFRRGNGWNRVTPFSKENDWSKATHTKHPQIKKQNIYYIVLSDNDTLKGDGYYVSADDRDTNITLNVKRRNCNYKQSDILFHCPENILNISGEKTITKKYFHKTYRVTIDDRNHIFGLCIDGKLSIKELDNNFILLMLCKQYIVLSKIPNVSSDDICNLKQFLREFDN